MKIIEQWLKEPYYIPLKLLGHRDQSYNYNYNPKYVRVVIILYLLYPFSHNHESGKSPYKWKETYFEDIPFSTEPWLWEEGVIPTTQDLSPILAFNKNLAWKGLIDIWSMFFVLAKKIQVLQLAGHPNLLL